MVLFFFDVLEAKFSNFTNFGEETMHFLDEK
jgi:hypothetical protein